MVHVDSQSGSQRQTIRAHLTAARAGFHALLDGLTDADLRRPSGNPAWTVRAVLTHLVWSLELLPREVASARKGRGMYNFPPILRDGLNAWATRLAARGRTIETLRQRYDAAYSAALALLDGLGDDELQLGARFWSEGFRDIAGLYAAQVDHLAEHADAVRCAVPRLASAARTTHS
jgi:DinB superfamily